MVRVGVGTCTSIHVHVHARADDMVQVQQQKYMYRVHVAIQNDCTTVSFFSVSLSYTELYRPQRDAYTVRHVK